MELTVLETVCELEERALRDAGTSAEVFVDLNHRFHETLWSASRNRYLMRQLRSLREMIEQLQDTTLRDPARQRSALAEHRAIVAAIADRDTANAERLARDHFRRAMAARLVADVERFGRQR